MVMVLFQFFTTKPLACDPSSLPQYPPSKEFDAKIRDDEARRYHLFCCSTKILYNNPAGGCGASLKSSKRVLGSCYRNAAIIIGPSLLCREMCIGMMVLPTL